MNFAKLILIFAIRIYRAAISPVLATVFGPLARCRFEPTCSRYAQEAIQKHGAVRGSFMATKRICRCNPFGGCGHDPVPENFELKDSSRVSHGKIFSHGS